MEYSASPESVTVRLTNDSFGIVRGQRTQNNTVYIQYSKYKTVKLRKIESIVTPGLVTLTPENSN